MTGRVRLNVREQYTKSVKIFVHGIGAIARQLIDRYTKLKRTSVYLVVDICHVSHVRHVLEYGA